MGDLHSTLVRFYELSVCFHFPIYRIYIPHWLDSMIATKSYWAAQTDIYIPHWLDSMPNNILCNIKNIIIYIPHWLDSMKYWCMLQ